MLTLYLLALWAEILINLFATLLPRFYEVLRNILPPLFVLEHPKLITESSVNVAGTTQSVNLEINPKKNIAGQCLAIFLSTLLVVLNVPLTNSLPHHNRRSRALSSALHFASRPRLSL